MRRVFVLGLMLFGCSKPTEPGQATSAAPSLSGPRVSTPPVTKPRPLPSAGSPEAIAAEGGCGMHASATKGCKDQKCIGERCGPWCRGFMDEKFKSFATVSQRNRIYFDCFGSCLGGPPDGGDCTPITAPPRN